MPCHIISHHIISYHIISRHIIPHHIIPYHTVPHHMISYDIILQLVSDWRANSLPSSRLDVSYVMYLPVFSLALACSVCAYFASHIGLLNPMLFGFRLDTVALSWGIMDLFLFSIRRLLFSMLLDLRSAFFMRFSRSWIFLRDRAYAGNAVAFVCFVSTFAIFDFVASLTTTSYLSIVHLAFVSS